MHDRNRKRSEFGRMLCASVALHVLLLVVLMVSPAPSAIAPPDSITVDLVAYAPAPAPEAAPEPATALPEPAEALPEPAAAPPAPQPSEVVLPERPREPEPKPEPKTKPKPRPEPEAKPEPKPRRREVVLKPETKVERSLDELLAEMREEAGEPAPEPAVQAATSTPTPAATPGAGVRVPPEVAAWMARVKAHIRRTWVVPFDFREQALATHVVLTLDASGALRGAPRVVRSSGNLSYDDSVLGGIRRSDPLPAPPEPGEWPFVFDTEDSL